MESRKAVAALSSHIDVSQTSASVEYHYSDFKHDPIDVLERYFDVFTYIANWGDQRLAFRFDSDAVDVNQLRAFAQLDCITVEPKRDSIIFNCWFTENYVEYSFFDESDHFYDGHSVSTSAFTSFHTDIVEGDLRSIYLLWLRAVELGHVDPSVSLEIPKGLNRLQEVHTDLIHFIGLSRSLLEACCRHSGNLSKKPKTDLRLKKYLSKLTREERDSFLECLLAENPITVRSRLRKKLSNFAPQRKAIPDSKSVRTMSAAQLISEADEIRRQKEEAIQQSKEERKQDYLKVLGENEDRMWEAVPKMIEEKKTKSYMNAALTLQALKYLAENRSSIKDYFARAEAIVSRYPKLTGMRSRMEDVGLITVGEQSKDIRRHWETDRWMKENPPENEYPFEVLLK